jgi:hypothetical protein
LIALRAGMSTFCYTPKNTKQSLLPKLFSWVIGLLLIGNFSAFAQISSKLSVLEIDKQVKTFLDPVKGLNNDIRAGLLKIEQTCSVIAKSKLDETKKLALSSPDPQTVAMRSEISSAKQITVDQNDALTKYIQEARIKLAPQSKSCEGLTALIKTSDACSNYKAATEAINHINDAGVYYYGEALGRFSSYESAYELEQKGCTRPGFSYRLWAAEQTHLMPVMKTSAQTLSELLR